MTGRVGTGWCGSSRRRQLSAFDLGAATWLDGTLDVPEVMGADHGTTVCFEIFGDYVLCSFKPDSIRGLTCEADAKVDQNGVTLGIQDICRFNITVDNAIVVHETKTYILRNLASSCIPNMSLRRVTEAYHSMTVPPGEASDQLVWDMAGNQVGYG
ncbi:hypothetical protein QBC43DRAFT_333410 [Cladorrhinum sp. PSN259]|nr:hypothetical protein QBC43DRAFT_333410 [Cladorrhinum sp. PSN259]